MPEQVAGVADPLEGTDGEIRSIGDQTEAREETEPILAGPLHCVRDQPDHDRSDGTEHRPGPTDNQRVRIQIEVCTRDRQWMKNDLSNFASCQPAEQRVTAFMNDLHPEPSQWCGCHDQNE